MTVRALVISATLILLLLGLLTDDKSQKVCLALTAIGIIATLAAPGDKRIFPPKESPTIIHVPTLSPIITITPSPITPPSSTPSPTVSPTPIPEPQSLYGRALKRSIIDHVHYEDWEKANIITETYYDRKDADGTHKEWYTSAKYDDRNTGYTIGLYFADGLLFFASAYHVGEADAVTFYFWGNQMIACHNLVGGEDNLSYAGSDTYNYMLSAFGNIYEKAQLYAQDAK